MYPAHIRGDKNVQACREHCVNVGELAEMHLQSIGLGQTGYLAGLLHDCGKFTDTFAEYLQRAANGERVRRGSVIHSFAAVSFLLENYHDTPDDNDGIKSLTSEILACADGSHHGLFDCIDADSNSGFDYRLAKQREYDLQAVKHFFEECMEKDEIDGLFEKAVREVKGQVALLRSLCRTENRKGKDLQFLLSLMTRMITSAVVDADRRDTAAFMRNEPNIMQLRACMPWQECLTQLTVYLDTFPRKTDIQKARRSLSDLCAGASVKPTGIYTLNLPTGGGKTLSALRFALFHASKYDKERIFYISPLLSILDQNADVIRRALGHEEWILEHHSDIINEGKTEGELEQYEFLTETWDSPIVITTLVQFLNTLFSAKMSSVRRFHALKNSIVIIDEVQTVPGNMLTLFNLALAYLSAACNTTFILCSATQPEFGRIPYPIERKELLDRAVVSCYEPVFRRNIIIDKGHCRLEGTTQHIAELLTSHRSVLVVCNKKSESSMLFSLLQEQNVKTFHLSAGMCMAHRKEVLSHIRKSLETQEKIVCVSTQVIEAGVDISFDAVIRLSAGMDSIVQSAGRCNRNGESKALSPVWIVKCDDENLSRLQEIGDARAATEALLDAYKRTPEQFSEDLSSDQAIRFYYEKLYAGKARGFFDYTVSGDSIYSMLSDNCQRRNSAMYPYLMAQAFRSAGEAFQVFDTDQKTVIVPWQRGKDIIEKLWLETNGDLKDLLERAKPYTVSVYEYQFRKLQDSGAIQLLYDGVVAVLSDGYYDENTGIKEETNECSIQIW